MRTNTWIYLTLCAVLGLSSSALADVRYGIICPARFDSSSLPPIGNAYGGCTALHGYLDSIGTRVFYWETNFGEIHALEENSPWEDIVEDTDITYVGTHGGTWSRFGASLTGTRVDDRAMSKKIKLGDEGRGTSVLALQACATLAPYVAVKGGRPGPESWWGGRKKEYDAVDDIFARWSKTMRSGLRMIVGSWDSVPLDAYSMNATMFGFSLAAGIPIWEAWRAALRGPFSNADPAVLASGTSEADCFNRLNNMTITTLNNYTRLKDNQIQSMCWAVDF